MVTGCQHRASFSWPEKKSNGHPSISRGCAIVRKAICQCMQKQKFGQRMRPNDDSDNDNDAEGNMWLQPPAGRCESLLSSSMNERGPASDNSTAWGRREPQRLCTKPGEARYSRSS
jgi:hypothetical protein